MLTATQLSTRERARERFGKPFADEPGSDWKPNAEPLLTRWLREKVQEKKPNEQQ